MVGHVTRHSYGSIGFFFCFVVQDRILLKTEIKMIGYGSFRSTLHGDSNRKRTETGDKEMDMEPIGLRSDSLSLSVFLKSVYS